jgi:chromosome segregation ATPase
MKVFAEKSQKARKVAEEPTAAQAPTSHAGEDRLAKGFELLFGAHIQEQRADLEREHSALTERLGALERTAAQHTDAVEELQDKARATLEREQGEYRRRKGIDDELRQMIVELRTLVTTTVAELHDRTARLEGSVLEELKAARDAESTEQTTRHEELFGHLEETLAELKSQKLDRSELAGFFTALAHQFETE